MVGDPLALGHGGHEGGVDLGRTLADGLASSAGTTPSAAQASAASSSTSSHAARRASSVNSAAISGRE